MSKISELEERINTLFDIKLQTTSLYEINGTDDWNLQKKKEQSQIMEILGRLKEIKRLDKRYFQSYLDAKPSLRHIWDVFTRSEFDAIWDAFM